MPEIAALASSSRTVSGDVPVAIRLEDVGKVYRLYSSIVDQALDVLGVSSLMFWRRRRHREFRALDGINLQIQRGERLGIIGRNGAGKTTLLKLITGNFAASSGTVEISGSVQALMQTGLGFHPEFTGYENIRSSLLYNGLGGDEFEAALREVIDFAELDEFLHQPLKTYSAGMMARLQFACSTAIRPDILIVDEVLGAGDAYFSAKSAHRMEKLTATGCTLLLVSHSMQQVLQFCDRAIWVESGTIVMEGEALSVVRAYEQYTQKLERRASQGENLDKSILYDEGFRRDMLTKVLAAEAGIGGSDDPSAGLPKTSRWEGAEPGLTLNRVSVLDDEGRELKSVAAGQPMNIEVEIKAEETGRYPCYFVILLFTEDGRWLCRHCSTAYDLELRQDDRYVVRLRYPEVLLGNGTYSFSAAVYRTLDLNRLNAAKFYDLLSRSFQIKVVDTHRDDLTLFHHPASWQCVRGGGDEC